jgi:hypothetical protein
MHSEAGWAYAATGVKVAAAMHAINSKRVAAILSLDRSPKKKKLASDFIHSAYKPMSCLEQMIQSCFRGGDDVGKRFFSSSWDLNTNYS